jgi:hypothetical protein
LSLGWQSEGEKKPPGLSCGFSFTTSSTFTSLFTFTAKRPIELIEGDLSSPPVSRVQRPQVHAVLINEDNEHVHTGYSILSTAVSGARLFIVIRQKWPIS